MLILHNLGEQIKELGCDLFNMPSTNDVELVDTFNMQWATIRTNLHYVGATLNSRFVCSSEVNNSEVQQGFLCAITRILSNFKCAKSIWTSKI